MMLLLLFFFSPARQHSRKEVTKEAEGGCQLIHAGTCGGDIHRSSRSMLPDFVFVSTSDVARPMDPCVR